MTIGAALYSSASDEWATPKDLFATLDREFGFDLDAAATAENALCEQYFDAELDGLTRRWVGTVWLNPPYGRTVGAWIAKAHSEAQLGATVACLLPARTDTTYWHEHVMRADEIRFIRGRLRFGDAPHGAPFPSCVVVFRPGCAGPPRVSAIGRDGVAL